ncbi:MAG: class I SAM-dependent DNA methyltransferase [Candidatus Brocadiae bacterium]|nr:class I SAM-dependent DNA methyltransferase [Candidatus Brocadiia bacterium]
MNPAEFIAKWRRNRRTERSACQEHFLDLCRLIDHPAPGDVDALGDRFTFERRVVKGKWHGWADVWKKGVFAWEYKGRLKDLDAAYRQLLGYREALENPPLLVVSDMERIIIRTNFVNTVCKTIEVDLLDLSKPEKLQTIRDLFNHPERLKPEATRQKVTAEAAERIGRLAHKLRKRGVDSALVARFLDRVVFCMFAEDTDLLSDGLFSKLVEKCRHNPEQFAGALADLFKAMAKGGLFGIDKIRHFNGHLFTDAAVIQLDEDEIEELYLASRLEWSEIDPSIFGTLFERGLNPEKRTQFGAHYTSAEDIERLVDPVVMKPLRKEWEVVQREADALLAKAEGPVRTSKRAITEQLKVLKKAEHLIERFLYRLATVTVLDPACGSGNFLYVALKRLKDLEKTVRVWAIGHGAGNFLARVHPQQLFGIELDPYSHELAQMSIWIGFLQWMHKNGETIDRRPLLDPLGKNFQNRDAIVDLTDQENPREPRWPKVDFIVGNPPFLGGKLLRSQLGDKYVDAMFKVWKGRVPAEADLCCYWFEKAREALAKNECRRAGLLATQGIRGGANREVLKRIMEGGGVFFAESDRDWVLDGANVHISMVGFDGGEDSEKVLDGKPVTAINANLTSTTDITAAESLSENRGIAFMGDTKGGAFDIDEATARAMLEAPNAHGLPNSDVVRPWVNGLDITRGSRRMWIVDFEIDRAESDAAKYEVPFKWVQEHVKAIRAANKRDSYRRLWWQHVEARPAMNAALRPLSRFLVTARVSKHRLFSWIAVPTLPDCQLIAFARADDYFFGVLHSRIHEVWSRSQATQVREKESGTRYTPTTCFETFPFPWPPGLESEADPACRGISYAAADLNRLRQNWLEPKEWMKEEVLEFRARVKGPWAAFVRGAATGEIGTAKFVRQVVAAKEQAAELQKRSLTALYNARPKWLVDVHAALDAAVFASYAKATGDSTWKPGLSDEEVLVRLLHLNRARLGATKA